MDRMTEATTTSESETSDLPYPPSDSTFDDQESPSGAFGKILAWGRAKAPETRRQWPSDDPPPRDSSFEDKMAFYRGQHTTVGIRATHLVGIPGAACAIPILVVRPKLGVAVFGVSWVIQVAGHKIFERNNPALTQGFLTYQFAGLAFWCEEMGDKVKGR